MFLKVVNISKNQILGRQVERADTFWLRLKGLMGRKNFPPGSGLLISPCNSIHTFFMNFPIDVIFLDSEKKVIFLREEVTPSKLVFPVKEAVQVVELPAGTISMTNTEIGDSVEIKS